MKIGFDLDKIFIDYPPLVPDRIIDRLYKKKSNGELQYRIPSRPEQTLRRLSHLSLFRPPIQKNIAFLEELATLDHQLFLISSRFGFLTNETEKLMKKHRFDKLFHSMHFNFENKQPHIFKQEIIAQLQLEVYVDDDLALLQYLAKHNTETVFFWLNTKSAEKEISRHLFAIPQLSCILKHNYA